eukprot:2812218-Amphidinium_carterae.1
MCAKDRGQECPFNATQHDWDLSSHMLLPHAELAVSWFAMHSGPPKLNANHVELLRVVCKIFGELLSAAGAKSRYSVSNVVRMEQRSQ